MAPFTASIDGVSRRLLGASWRPGCPVEVADLRQVSVSHWNYAGNRRQGRIVVHRRVATEVREVFRRLYDQRFQIRQIRPVAEFDASDDRSMAANNTSGFNCRYVAGTTTWSQHSYGRAIDVNPIQNPYVRNGVADPPAGEPWIDRSHGGPGMAMPGNVVVRAFAAIGWEWGGDWRSAKDYQHFSQNGR